MPPLKLPAVGTDQAIPGTLSFLELKKLIATLTDQRYDIYKRAWVLETPATSEDPCSVDHSAHYGIFGPDQGERSVPNDGSTDTCLELSMYTRPNYSTPADS